jgi:hypothetical protein
MDARLKQYVDRYNIKTRDGHLILYKGVTKKFEPPLHRPKACRDKEPYKPGTLVTCRRVNRDPKKSCGAGLHVGTLDCARLFSMHLPTPDCARLFSTRLFSMHGRVVQVAVKPEDVVCVPDVALVSSTAWDQKIRVKRLQVLK